jgi:Lon protease-like protein
MHQAITQAVDSQNLTGHAPRDSGSSVESAANRISVLECMLLLESPQNPPNRMAETELPDSIPVITLHQCNLLPHGLLPLYIFELRYQQMLEYALSHDRLFCVSTKLPGAEELDDDDAVYSFSTAGLVRACVRQDDGTSHLVLQGIQRVRFIEWIQTEPFRIVRIKAIDSTDRDPAQSGALREQLTEALASHSGANEDFLKQLRAMPSAEMVADVVGFNLIGNPEERQPLLEMEEVSDRLEFLLKVFATIA